ncbi:hypothetical protein F53441_6724 [Fusarium austroafricanum]|uniref:Uncharacterized protein n=1 Tax=Fusarium austroafricanum TaxID=2364996 RepID=A0A8H4KH63_9HYPO|nr:hypothetical protein F53441_6724 [Fusarium austroafricanum]
MSPEREPTDSVPNQGDTPPVKKSAKHFIDKNDTAGIRKRLDEAIACILPAVKDHPALYKSVVDQIENSSFRRSWADSVFYKSFHAWCVAAGQDARPHHVFFLAALAVYSSFKNPKSKFSEEVVRRGLREWVDKELDRPHPFSSTTVPTRSKSPQQASRVKIEPGTSRQGLVKANSAQVKSQVRDGKVQQSIESDLGSVTTGTKRHAPEHEDKPAIKRANVVDETFLAARINRLVELQAPQRRVVLKDEGTQTDSDVSLQAVLGPMQAAMEAMKEQADGLKEQIRQLQDHNMILQDHDRALADISGRVRIHQMRPANNIHRQQYQPQAQELVPLAPVNRQPPAYYCDTGRDMGSGGQIFQWRQ